MKLKAIKSGEIEKPPGPKMGVEPIEPDGSIGVKFNQKMIAPQGELDQCMYSVAFGFDVESRGDGSKAQGAFCPDTKAEKGGKKRELAKTVSEPVPVEADAMAFKPSVKSHTDGKIVMGLEFANPRQMSIGGQA